MKLNVKVSGKKMLAADAAFEAIQEQMWDCYNKGVYLNSRKHPLRRRHRRAKQHMMKAWHMHRYAYEGKDWKEK